MTSSIYTSRAMPITGDKVPEQLMSALLHGFQVVAVQYQRGRGSCIPYTAKIRDNPPRAEFVPTFSDDWRYE